MDLLPFLVHELWGSYPTTSIGLIFYTVFGIKSMSVTCHKLIQVVPTLTANLRITFLSFGKILYFVR